MGMTYPRAKVTLKLVLILQILHQRFHATMKMRVGHI